MTTESDTGNTGTGNEQPAEDHDGERPAESVQDAESQAEINGNVGEGAAGFPAAQPGMGFPGNAGGAVPDGDGGTNPAWILLGASVFVLFAGLFVAVKIRH